MGLFSSLFGKTDDGGKLDLSPEQFIQTPYVKDILLRYQKRAVLLNPRTTAGPIDPKTSKFGGTPNLNGFDTYPCCDTCQTPLNFVLQLYQQEFPEHYYPQGKDLFQLFRCPNGACPDAYSEPFLADHKMFVYYFADTEELKTLAIPEPLADEGIEAKVPDCRLEPKRVYDYPVDDDFDNVINDIEEGYGEDLSEYFIGEYSAIQRTKCGGYPSFTQPAHYPVCECGKIKEFFFQLSSEDTEDGVTNPAPDNWSPHDIMIGDLGNIYFYVCKDCGEKSITSYWDCY